MRRLLSAAADAAAASQLRGFATRVAVVGGGVAGLAAAKSLVSIGVACTLLDMGDGGVGGRLTSQQAQPKSAGQPLSFDHGAQLFLATSPDFQAEVASWAAAGVAQQWHGRHGRITKDYTFEPRQSPSDDGSGSGSSSGGGSGASKSAQPRWVGVPSNGAIPAHMARQLAEQHPSSFQLQSSCAVQSMERLGGGCGSPTCWQLRGSLGGQEQAELGTYDAVILADAAPLLPGSPGYVEGLEAAASSLAQLARSVQAVSYQPRFTLTVAFASPLPGVPFDFASVEDSGGGARACGSCGCGACGSISGGAFQGVACNSSKPGRPGSGSSDSGGSSGASADGPQCWVGVSTAQRAQQLVDQFAGRYEPQSEQYHAAVAEELMADFRDIMAPFVQGFAVPQPIYCQAHWWGRAFANEPLGSEFLLLPAQRLALCGDVALGSGVEKAWRSGRAAGEAVGRMLASGTAG